MVLKTMIRYQKEKDCGFDNFFLYVNQNREGIYTIVLGEKRVQDSRLCTKMKIIFPMMTRILMNLILFCSDILMVSTSRLNI